MIVKNLLVVGVVAGFASAAVAEDAKGSWSVGGRVRLDAEQSTTESTVSDVKTTSKSSSVSLNRAQFSLTGTRDKDSLGIVYYADSNTLYSATISHKFSDMVTAHFGRMKLLAQSWENSYEGIDQHMLSWAGMHAPANSDGARVDLAFGDNKVSVQAVEGVSSFSMNNTTTQFGTSGGLTTGIQYSGEINKMIKPIVSYTMVRTTSTKGTETGKTVTPVNYGNGYQTQLGAGVQVAVAGATVDLEYDSIKMHKRKNVTGAKDQDLGSIIAQVKYPVGMTTPFLKLASETWKKGQDKSEGDMKHMGLTLGVEHALDSSCRLHAFYMSDAKTTTVKSKEDKTTMMGFNFGVTASM